MEVTFHKRAHPMCTLQDIVLEYTTRLLKGAVDSAVARGRVKPGSRASVPVAIGAEDILFLVRKVRSKPVLNKRSASSSKSKREQLHLGYSD